MSASAGASQSSRSTVSAGGTSDTASVGGTNTTSSSTSSSDASGTLSASEHSSSLSHQGSALLADTGSADNTQTTQLPVGQEVVENPIGRFLSDTDSPFAMFRDANGDPVTVGRAGPSMAQTIDSILNPPE
ncbi:unnamed protein product [Clonostachys solani]|uniref:Uncharacterized protein n=1 Tax=Clonostachys solani TaxID=160281 RepID=A0A9P0EES8_9HYPO|nr:unnamed protein product [Clonostachys solani]